MPKLLAGHEDSSKVKISKNLSQKQYCKEQLFTYHKTWSQASPSQSSFAVQGKSPCTERRAMFGTRVLQFALVWLSFLTLDISVLDEMPANRKKIITQMIPPSKRDAIYQFIRDQIKSGRQIFGTFFDLSRLSRQCFSCGDNSRALASNWCKSFAKTSFTIAD